MMWEFAAVSMGNRAWMFLSWEKRLDWGIFLGLFHFARVEAGSIRMHREGHGNAGLVGMIKQWVLNCLGVVMFVFVL